MMKILIIDDERAIRYSMKDIIEYEGYQVEEASDGAEGLKKIEATDYALIFCDIKMPKMDGIEVLEKALAAKQESKFCMISGHGTIETAVECLKKGAIDYIEKPLDITKLLKILKEFPLDCQKSKETKTNTTQKNKNTTQGSIEKGQLMIGSSAKMKEMYSFIEKVAPTDARILITGDNGSGKELVAKALYQLSQRKSMPLIEVNCAAIPNELIESELFGHEKGAFTSAIKQRKGDFEQADGGTLFLDEIGDMSLSAQSKVLRALQENKITRVGGEKEIDVNVRVIAATNKDLKKEMEENRFRQDLYHRLSVIVIKVPSLDDRKEDIPLLVDYFLDTYSKETNIKKPSIDKAALERLMKMSFPGNVRELKNITERLAILCEGKITAKDIDTYAHEF